MPAKFDNIDTEKVAKTLKLKRKGELDGTSNEPDVNQTLLTVTESKVKGAVETHWSNECEKNASYFSDLQISFAASKELLRADGHDMQVINLKTNCTFLISKLKRNLDRTSRELKKKRHELQQFKTMNELIRPPIVKSERTMTLAILLVAGMFIFETSANTSLLQGAVAGGILGGLAIAVVVSFINIGCSFLLGRMTLPHLNHINVDNQNRAKFIIAIYLPVIIYFNFAMGIFRSVSEMALLKGDKDAVAIAAQSAVWPFNDLDQLTFASAGLIATGLIFAIVALIDGFKYDDPYPNYGSYGREHKKAKDAWSNATNAAAAELDRERLAGVAQLESLKKKRLAANEKWGLNVDLLQIDFPQYEAWVRHLIEDGNRLITIYRGKNKALRSNTAPPPAYFSEDIKFDVIVNARDRFPSVRMEIMDDEKKKPILQDQQDVIMTESRISGTELNSYYRDVLQDLNQYIASRG